MMFRLVLAMQLAMFPLIAVASWHDPLDPIVITTSAVASKQKPITRVVREAGPGGWQLYDAGPLAGGPVVMPKTEALKLDPSLRSLINLPVGWEAARRDATSPWVRKKVPL